MKTQLKKRIAHFLFGHSWQEIDSFYIRKLYISPFERGFRYYKCSCGLETRKPSEKLVVY